MAVVLTATEVNQARDMIIDHVYDNSLMNVLDFNNWYFGTTNNADQTEVWWQYKLEMEQLHNFKAIQMASEEEAQKVLDIFIQNDATVGLDFWEEDDVARPASVADLPSAGSIVYVFRKFGMAPKPPKIKLPFGK